MRKKVISVIAIALVAITLSVVAVSALTQGDWLGEYNSKYEKPSIGDMVSDGKYPDELSSSTSVNAREKEWYEYITYSDEPIAEPYYQDSSTRVYYYDPFDYSYGMIMETSDVVNGAVTKFSTANAVEYMVKTTNSIEAVVSQKASIESSITAEIKASVGAGMKDFYWAEVGSTITSKLSSTLDTNVQIKRFSETVTQETKTFDAVHFNTAGVPYSWRVVEYTVYLPLKCDVQLLRNGEWVSSGVDTYCLLATVQGTCRQVIVDGITYSEHWGNSELVTEDEFWQGFFTKEALIKAYEEKLIPKND